MQDLTMPLVMNPPRPVPAAKNGFAGKEKLDRIINGALFEAEYREMILVKGIAFASSCRECEMPFAGKAHVAYVPDRRLVGLSKIPRIVRAIAASPQLQESLTSRIAEALAEKLKPLGTAAVLEARHSCMERVGRGLDPLTLVTCALTGIFKSDARTRNEFLCQVRT